MAWDSLQPCWHGPASYCIWLEVTSWIWLLAIKGKTVLFSSRDYFCSVLSCWALSSVSPNRMHASWKAWLWSLLRLGFKQPHRHIIPLSTTLVVRRARSRAAANTKHAASCTSLLELLDPFAQGHFSALLIKRLWLCNCNLQLRWPRQILTLAHKNPTFFLH